MTHYRASFSYINEGSIDSRLKCPLCREPYIEPVIRPDGSRSCRQCALSTDDPNQIIRITEPLLLDLLDTLAVQCQQCLQTNIQRKDFQNHFENECSRRTVACSAADLNCPWKGLPDHRHRHVASCPFEALRACLSPLIAQLKTIKKHMPLDQTADEEEDLGLPDDPRERQSVLVDIKQNSYSIARLQQQLDQLEQNVGTVPEPTSAPAPSISTEDAEILRNELTDVKAALEQEMHRNDQLEKQLERLQIQYEELQSQMNSGEFDGRRESEKGDYGALVKQIENCQQTSNELKQQCFRHDIQIRFLARSRCLLPATTDYKNEILESIINAQSSDDLVDLQDENLNDADLDVIYEKAVVEKPCQQLHLDRNLFTVKGAITLSMILIDNFTLTELHLSHNRIHDAGVHILAQTLAINNTTLTLLTLDGNHLTDQSAEYLAEMLKINRTLKSLSLGSNRISNHGLCLLIDTLIDFNETLRYLSLQSNPSITDASIDSVTRILQSNAVLQTIELGQCGLSDEGIEQLRQIVNNCEHMTISF